MGRYEVSGAFPYVRVNRETGCWEWARCRVAKGYGFIRNGGRGQQAHRWVYEMLVGPIPEGLTLDHLCRNHSCVRPAHLEAVTMGENARRGNAPGHLARRTGVCQRGHSDWVQRKRQRVCRTCSREYMRRWQPEYRRRKAVSA